MRRTTPRPARGRLRHVVKRCPNAYSSCVRTSTEVLAKRARRRPATPLPARGDGRSTVHCGSWNATSAPRERTRPLPRHTTVPRQLTAATSHGTITARAGTGNPLTRTAATLPRQRNAMASCSTRSSSAALGNRAFVLLLLHHEQRALTGTVAAHHRATHHPDRGLSPSAVHRVEP